MKTEILPKNHSRVRLQDEISACITEIPESLPSTIGKETPPHPMKDVQLENSVPSLLSDKIEEMSLQKTRDSEIAFPEIRLRWVRRQKKLAILSQDHHLSISPTILNREVALTKTVISLKLADIEGPSLNSSLTEIAVKLSQLHLCKSPCRHTLNIRKRSRRNFR